MNHSIHPRVKQFSILFAILLCSSCAARRPITRNWRLVSQDAGARLVPPDIAKPDITHRTVRMGIPRSKGPCPPPHSAIDLRPRGRHFEVKITTDALARQNTGWLGKWASQLEEQQCVAAGGGRILAERIVESVPLDPGGAFRLLYSDDRETGEIDLIPMTRLQVVSPLWRRDGIGLMADGPYSVTAGEGTSLTITGKSTENLLGYETAFYSLRPLANGLGSTIVPLHSDRNIQGKTERQAAPSVNFFPLSPSAAFHRLFYKSGQNDFTAILIAARTPAELNERTRAMTVGSSSAPCADVDAGMCLAIPKAIAVNPMIVVTVNQTEVLLFRGATLLQAIRRAGQQQPNEVLSTLAVRKPWNGKLMPLEFDRSSPAVLRLVLRGGEVVSWR